MRLLMSLAMALALSVAAAISFVWGEARAPAQAGDLAASGWARATPPGAKVGAAYVTIANQGRSPDRLLHVESGAAGTIMLHETVEAGGVAEMRPLDGGIPVAPGHTLAMAPGGMHIMLMDLTAPMMAGGSLPLTLVFEKAGPLQLEVSIEPIGSPGPQEPAPHSHSAH